MTQLDNISQEKTGFGIIISFLWLSPTQSKFG
jgi:hypothetical protein